MKRDQFLGIVRHVLTAGGGILVTLGYTTDSVVQSASGAVLALAAVGWSIWAKNHRIP